ncbi:MAG: hypothetical protein FWD09_07000 [Lentimicrobiaceae bacterium]|nr:hypothetical protein [Lentimicrobiaceae bacterium]
MRCKLAPIYFTYYKNDTIPANIIALDSIQSALPAGDTLCFTFTIHNWNAYEPIDSVWISANDRNGVYPYQAQCVTDGRRIARNEEINSAVFYANDVYYEYLQDTTFCAKNVYFRAKIEGALHPEPGRIKWFINDPEQLSPLHVDETSWAQDFETGNYDIEMWVRYANDETDSKQGILKMEIFWIKLRNVRY